MKFLWKKLLDGTLKPRKIKLEVFLNWRSKKCVKFQKKFAPYNRHLNPHPLAIFFKMSQDFVFSDSCTRVHGFEEETKFEVWIFWEGHKKNKNLTIYLTLLGTLVQKRRIFFFPNFYGLLRISEVYPLTFSRDCLYACNFK